MSSVVLIPSWPILAIAIGTNSTVIASRINPAASVPLTARSRRRAAAPSASPAAPWPAAPTPPGTLAPPSSAPTGWSSRGGVGSSGGGGVVIGICGRRRAGCVRRRR